MRAGEDHINTQIILIYHTWISFEALPTYSITKSFKISISFSYCKMLCRITYTDISEDVLHHDLAVLKYVRTVCYRASA